ncbi:MAG: GDSL-type esterase/lipase family protein [Bacteroidales bacterium]|nr:GDSL-type esterase/lipase family protein [Bacteroidales bacterium]
MFLTAIFLFCFLCYPGVQAEAFVPQDDVSPDKTHIYNRGTLNNCRIKFEREKKGRVAFMGGSITEMKGWREMICEELQRRFPDTEFDFIAAGISSTGTTPGAFRFERDVLKNGTVDLLFEEAAVNDETNGFNAIEQIRGMEGIIRQARLSNPDMDIIMLHFIWDEMLDPLASGKIPEVIQNHERVAAYYQVSSIDLASEVSQRMQDGEFDWKMFGGTHPAPLGHKIYAATISRLFDQMWQQPLPDTARIHPHLLPPVPMDSFSYYRGRLADIREARLKHGWKYEPEWIPKLKASTRKGFVNVPALEALDPGSELYFTFEGTAIGIFNVAGPDAGIIEYSVDGQPFRQKDLYTKWSRSLYIPWVTMLESELPDGKHEIVIRTGKQNHPESKGNACQIFYFTINDRKL